ncbi:MAG: M50 family metallopeptidase [Deltaproteobacteria bacterium]|nr:M50 family metallopeptidase [Deltaproteobacteria bacterium]
MVLSQKIDNAINFTKWPVALVCVFLTIPSGIAFAKITWVTIRMFSVTWPFWAGLAGYFILWRIFFRKRIFGSAFSTFEHELTHAIFAWLTIHRVSGLRISWNNGGSVSFTPPGNWLIYLGPYFFPTFAIAVIPFVLSGGGKTALIILGILTSYHLTSTWVETHLGQSDLQRAGFIFSFILIPFSHFFWYGLIMGIVSNKSNGAVFFFEILTDSVQLMYSFL